MEYCAERSITARNGPVNPMYRRIDKTPKLRNRDMKMNIVDQTGDEESQTPPLRNLGMIKNILVVKQRRM